MKVIMMSIRPEWVAKILNGEKTIEIRKRFPKDYVGWVYIYCTKGKTTTINLETLLFDNPQNAIRNGKVVARFWCDKVEEIDHWFSIVPCFNQTCLSVEELTKYLGTKNGYAIHITKLEIFNKPKEIGEFSVMREYTNCGRCPHAIDFGCSSNGWCRTIKPLNRAPQSWCYVEV